MERNMEVLTNQLKDMEKITFEEMGRRMYSHNGEYGSHNPLKAVIVFTEDSFTVPYTEKERSYKVSSNNKYWLPGFCSNSIFGDCLDGTDPGVRLDRYMFPVEGEGWKVEYCYFVEE